MVKNFCIFADGQKAEWHYGELTEEFIENTVSFLNGLDGIGKELFGSGVASIELDVKKTQDVAIDTTEIFVVSLYSQFFLIVSDPLTTIKLIEESGGILTEIEDVMRGVLGGQATVLYSNLYIEAENQEEQDFVDEIFRATIIGIGTIGENLDSIVGGGRISFGSFSFSEMLIFHYLLRKLFSRKFARPTPWAIVADDSGSPIHLSYGNVENTTSLAGYLSVLSLFCRELFGAPPKSIVFGGDNLIPLEMVNGTQTFCAFAAWDILFKLSDFLKVLNQMNTVTKEDINKFH